jgi:hypothetical protein
MTSSTERPGTSFTLPLEWAGGPALSGHFVYTVWGWPILAFFARVGGDAAKCGKSRWWSPPLPLSQKTAKPGTSTRFVGSVVSGTSDSLLGTAILANQVAPGPGASRGWNVRSSLPDLRLLIRNGMAPPPAPRSTRSINQDSASRRYERRGSARAVGTVRRTLHSGGYFHRTTDLHLLSRLFEPIHIRRGRIPYSSRPQAVDGGCRPGDKGAASDPGIGQVYGDEV